MNHNIDIYDTTLRDGTQAENFNLSVEDRIRISHKLDGFGIDFIEGGWPGSNPSAVDFFKAMQNQPLKHAKLTAFGSTRNINKRVDQDPNLQALIAARTPGITIFGKTWDVHVRDALRISLEDNLTIIVESLQYLKPHVEYLFYDAEHFFDGFKKNAEYALATLDKAVEGGAECLVLCDTNGGTLPNEIPIIIEAVNKHLDSRGHSISLGIHAHNDSETAVGNSLMAVSLGVSHVQGTMNGFGERCGNANLTSIIAGLALKMNCRFKAAEKLELLHETSRFVNELANLPHNKYQPYVGRSAFAHKGGVHVQAVERNPITYEHIDPEKVGNVRRILISDQSGKSNVLHKAKKFGLNLDSRDPAVSKIVRELKELENQGFQYEGAEASFELLMRKALGTKRHDFDLKGFRVISQKTSMDAPSQDEATIRIVVGNEGEVHTAALGEGPVNALDKALRKALTRFYPKLKDMELIDYKVRVLSGEHGTGAKVRVLIQSSDQESEWGTVGVSHDILEASWQALVDSVTYKLMKDEKNRVSERDVLQSKNRRKQAVGSGKIPVLVLVGLCLLSVSIFRNKSPAIFLQSDSASSESPGQFLWITGSRQIKEGGYFITREQLRDIFPELLPLVLKTPIGAKPFEQVTAIQYQADVPEMVDLPPEISNVFLLPIPINRAGKEVLSSLPGIGPVLAERIIQRRIAAGPFNSKDELLEVAGIGPEKFARLADHILID